MKKLVTVMLIVIICMSNINVAASAPNYSIEINAASRILRLFDCGNLVKEYPVAVGKATTKTPLGSFVIRNKVQNPSWNNKANGTVVPPGSNNPLGIRWLGISATRGTYGIHGNSTPSSIGTYASGGCIRMFNNDVEELYSIVGVSTPVKIIYENIILKQDSYSNSPVLIIYPDIYKQKNAAETLGRLAAENTNITQDQKDKALKLAGESISDPAAVCIGTAVFFNNQYITNDAFVEEQQLYVYYMAAVEKIGLDGTLMNSFSIPTIERNDKIYINLTQAAERLGGRLKLSPDKNNAYFDLSIIKINGRYLCSFKGDFDRGYFLESTQLNGIWDLNYKAASSINLKELCKQQKWEFDALSLNRTLDISVPLVVKADNKYIGTVAYNGRYYIDSDEAVLIAGIQDQNLNLYNYKDRNYYDVYEIMEKYEHLEDEFFTVIEVTKPLDNELLQVTGN